MAAYRVSQGPLIDRMQSAFDTEWIRYATVTDNFFSLLGRSSAAGRVFTRGDFSSGERVAVGTHSLWQRRVWGVGGGNGENAGVARPGGGGGGGLPHRVLLPSEKQE